MHIQASSRNEYFSCGDSKSSMEMGLTDTRNLNVYVFWTLFMRILLIKDIKLVENEAGYMIFFSSIVSYLTLK